MKGMEPVPAGAPADAIFDAFREFVSVHQALLNILIGKAGLFNTVPFIGQPVAAVLRQIEGVVDVSLGPPTNWETTGLNQLTCFFFTPQTVAFMLIDTVQSRASDLQSQANSLDMTLATCINSYEGVNLKAKRTPTLGSRSAAFRESLRV